MTLEISLIFQWKLKSRKYLFSHPSVISQSLLCKKDYLEVDSFSCWPLHAFAVQSYVLRLLR